MTSGHSSADGDGPHGPPSAHPENATLRRLRDELGDDAAVDHFIADFLDLLDQRMVSVRELLTERRLEDSITALLTIETSSVMVGADRLAETATRLRGAVADQRLSSYDGLLAELDAAAAQTKLELTHPSGDDPAH